VSSKRLGTRSIASMTAAPWHAGRISSLSVHTPYARVRLARRCCWASVEVGQVELRMGHCSPEHITVGTLLRKCLRECAKRTTNVDMQWQGGVRVHRPPTAWRRGGLLKRARQWVDVLSGAPPPTRARRGSNGGG
jgi:hypothetical protein